MITPIHEEGFRLAMYMSEVIVAIMVFIFMVKYLIGRIQVGMISLFMLSLFFFSIFFGIQNIAAAMLWSIRVFELAEHQRMVSIAHGAWTVSHVGTTITFWALGILIVRKRFDLQITIFATKDKKVG